MAKEKLSKKLKMIHPVITGSEPTPIIGSLPMVNVIITLGGSSFVKVISFPDTTEGSNLANSYVKNMLIELDVDQDDIDNILDEGFYSDDQGVEITIVHSDTVE